MKKNGCKYKFDFNFRSEYAYDEKVDIDDIVHMSANEHNANSNYKINTLSPR